jgi:hypothetical protein
VAVKAAADQLPAQPRAETLGSLGAGQARQLRALAGSLPRGRWRRRCCRAVSGCHNGQFGSCRDDRDVSRPYQGQVRLAPGQPRPPFRRAATAGAAGDAGLKAVTSKR